MLMTGVLVDQMILFNRVGLEFVYGSIAVSCIVSADADTDAVIEFNQVDTVYV